MRAIVTLDFPTSLTLVEQGQELEKVLNVLEGYATVECIAVDERGPEHLGLDTRRYTATKGRVGES